MEEDDELKEEAAENKVKDTLNNGKSKAAGVIKALFRLILKKCGKWIALVATVLILFIVLFNQFEKVIFKNIITDVKSAMGAQDLDGDGEPDIDFTSKAEIISKDGTYCLKVDKKVMEDIEKNLKEDNIDPIDLNLDDFDCFREFIKAEITTQYPQLGTIDKEKYKDDDDIITDGIIKIKRATPGKDTSQLFYKTPSEFQNLCDKNDSKALEYFTLNEKRELVIASYQKTDVEVTTNGDTSITEVPSNENIYTITTQTIDYLPIVQKYTMPFSLLLAILQTSDSEEMALEFAKLAQESEMEITIQDNIETTTYDEKNNVEQHIEGTKTVNFDVVLTDITTISTTDENGDATTSTTSNTYTVEQGLQDIEIDPQEKNCTVNVHTVIETNTPHVELTKVDCWIVKFENTYTYTDNTDDPEKSKEGPIENKKEEDVNCDISTDTDVAKFENSKIAQYSEVPDNIERTVNVNVQSLTANVKKVTTTTTNINTSTITKEYSTTKSKVEKNDEKIFKIFSGEVAGDDEELAEKLKQGYSSLYDAQDWFYGLLQSDNQTKDFVDIMKYFIKKFHNDPDAKEYDTDMYDAESFESAGGSGGVFGCNLSREEFIKKAKAYKKSDTTYQKNMAKYAGDFYDVCTQSKYNVNPCLAYAHACLETGYGSSSECQSIKNYFGMAHGNNAASGKGYSTVKESVEDYCKWILENATPGNNAYKQSVSVSKKYARYNKAFSGDPSTNMYDLYSRYAFLGSTHVTSDSDYTVEWGRGGRTYLRIIYGGYNYSSRTWSNKTNYDKKCGNKHKSATEKTTVAEQADYAEYSMNKRVSILTDIFGEEALTTGGGDILSVAKTIHTYIEKNNYQYSLNGLAQTFEESKKGNKVTCCATYISWVLYDAGYTKVKGINGCSLLSSTIKKNYKYKMITDKSKLKPGDICFKGGEHVQMYGENGVWYNAGSNNAISRSPYAYVWNDWTFALRILE